MHATALLSALSAKEFLGMAGSMHLTLAGPLHMLGPQHHQLPKKHPEVKQDKVAGRHMMYHVHSVFDADGLADLLAAATSAMYSCTAN